MSNSVGRMVDFQSTRRTFDSCLTLHYFMSYVEVITACTVVGYFQQLYSSIHSTIVKPSLQEDFDTYLEDKLDSRTCLSCGSKAVKSGYIILYAYDPGIPHYVCSEHYEVVKAFNDIRNL